MAPASNGRVMMEIPGFHGGSQLMTDPDKLEPHMVRKIENMNLDELGMAAMRMGCLNLGTVGAAGDRVLSSHVFQRAHQPTQFIVHLSDGTLRYSTNLTAWTTIASSLSTTAPFSYITFVDKVWMANGVNDYRSWDGAAQVTFASVPKFKYLTEWKDTLFGGGTGVGAGNEHRIWSSDAGDGTTWPAINFVDVAKGQGPGITALTSDANALIVFKMHEHHAIYDPVEYVNRVVDNEKGCISHFSIVKHRGLIYFVSTAGVCLYLGDAPAQIVSDPISPLFKYYTYQESNEALWWGYAFQDRVGWCWPRDSTTDFWQVEYYPALPDKPWIFQTYPVRVVVAVRDVADVDEMFGFGEGTNKVFQIGAASTFADDGVAYTGTVETGWFDFESPHAAKYVDRLITLSRGDFTIDVYTDFDEASVIKSYAVDGAIDLDRKEVFTDFYCQAVAFRIYAASGTSTDRTFPIGSEVEHVTEGKFAIGRLIAAAKRCGEYR